MSEKTTAELISNAAKREGKNDSEAQFSRKANEWYEEISGVGSRQNIFTPGRNYIYIVALDDQPITLSDFHKLKSNIRATRGQYTIQYIPAGSPKRIPKFPYVIGQDLVRIRVSVSGPSHWRALAKRIPELDWIRRNTTLSESMFGIAKKHPGLVLRFGIDFVKYCDKITNRANELGVDIDNKPLVIYQWGNNPPHVDDDGILEPIKTKSDYLKEIEEADHESTGEEQII